MSSMNLRTDEMIAEDSSRGMDKNIVVAIAILILILLLYGALFAANKFLASKVQETRGQYAEEYKVFTAGNANKIIDFENRSNVAKELIAGGEPAVLAMGQIESTLAPSIYLTSYKYEKDRKTIALEGVADNFNTIAKQILSFKENDYFATVIPGPAAFDENNKLNFSISLIKK